MQELRANTQVIVTVGPFPDVGDGFTPQTDITLGGDEAELIKHGSTSVVDISGATWAALASCRGYYSLTLTTSHTDTEGMLLVVVQDDSDCLPVKQEYMVLSEAAWDSKYAPKDTGFMDVHVKTVEAGIIANASFNADVGSTAHGTNIIALAVRKILEELNLDHLLKVDTTVAADGDLEAYCVAGTVMAHLLSTSADATLYKASTDSMQGIRDRGDSAWVTATGFALASVVGALADAAAAGEVTSADTLMQYLKQLINILIGTPGIGTFPAEAAPANAVSLAEVIRAIHVDTNAIQGKLPANKFMGSSDGADDDGNINTILTDAGRLTAVRAAVLTDWINGGRLDLLLDAIKVVTDALTSAVATKMAVSGGTIINGSAAAGTLSTTEITTDLTISVADQYNGRILIFAIDTTTAALRGQATDISATTVLNGKLGFTAITTAPSNGDTFCIV